MPNFPRHGESTWSAANSCTLLSTRPWQRSSPSHSAEGHFASQRTGGENILSSAPLPAAFRRRLRSCAIRPLARALFMSRAGESIGKVSLAAGPSRDSSVMPQWFTGILVKLFLPSASSQRGAARRGTSSRGCLVQFFLEDFFRGAALIRKQKLN